MLTATNGRNEKVVAGDVCKSDGPFRCLCGRDVFVHKGKIKIHHFAHKAGTECWVGRGESEKHLKCKMEIYEAIRSLSNVQNCELEKNFNTNVADVYAEIDGIKVAIEVQKSILSVNEISLRTKKWNDLGILVLWIVAHYDELPVGKVRPKAWEIWLHENYGSRLFYWLHGQSLQEIQFSRVGRLISFRHAEALRVLEISNSFVPYNACFYNARDLEIISDSSTGRRLCKSGNRFCGVGELLWDSADEAERESVGFMKNIGGYLVCYLCENEYKDLNEPTPQPQRPLPIQAA